MTSSAEPTFGRVVTAMVTPFDEAGALDLVAAADLARWLSDNGSTGLCVAGTTGEAPVLTDQERLDLVECVAGAVTIPVLAGMTTNDTEHSVGLVKQAKALGASGVLAVTPYYNRPSQAGLLGHFGVIAEATDLPVVLYDIPVRTGRKIATETILNLVSSHSNVIAVKDAAGDVASTAELIAAGPAHLEIYSGDDALTLPLLSVGAHGVISVASHWIGAAFASMIAAFLAGDLDGGASRNAELHASFRYEGSDRWPNPLPTKAVMRALGLKVGQCRLPMGPADAELESAAASMVASTANLRG